MTQPRVLCVVVNYRTAELTQQAVATLLNALQLLPDARVLIVDNDSRDGSFECLSEAKAQRGWSNVEVVASGRNGGFGFGCNVGIRYNRASASPARYVHILNSDAFPEPEAVAKLVDFMDATPSAGVATSVVVDGAGQVDVQARRFPSIASELDAALRLGVISKLLEPWSINMASTGGNQRCDWAGGVSMILRQDMLDQVGIFDEGYFLYYEELDLMFRARACGWQTWVVPESRVSHVGSASTQITDHSRPRPRYWFDSRSRFLRKSYGAAYEVATNLVWVAAFAAWRARRRIQGKSDTDPPGMLRDFVRYNFSDRLRAIMSRAS